MPDIRIDIGGTTYTGWQEVEVVRAIDALAGRFRVRLTTIGLFPLPRGREVEVYLDGQLIITGFVYTIEVDVDKGRHVITVSGRDKTADLVDADTLVPSQEVSGLTLREVVETIARPFGIQTVFEVTPSERFQKFAFQQETAFEAIERACRMRGVLPSSDENGNLVIRNYGSIRAATGLVMGENVLSATATYDDSNRFSAYYVFGQQPGSDDDEDEEAAAGPSGVARDLGMRRYRPKIIIAEASVDAGIAQARAEWEATTRAAKAATITVRVQDWVQSNGDLWRENMLVPAYLPEHGVEGDMLVKEITYTLGDDGTLTSLVLVRPDAYRKQPDVEAEENGVDKDDEDL